ncbi:MAG: hypothetical protein KAT30_07655, partial [Candidatus Krumholzibacteria bacterium]|nr:hypothetical protein [Candidatus Krumholzibacteria bacterium]
NAAAIGGDLVVDSRYNYVATVPAGGRTWFQIQMDSTWSSGGNMVADRYNIDLNDNLFVPGDTVWFFFGATNTTGKSTYWALPVPTPSKETDDVEVAASNPDEFTILPGFLADIFYVDGMNFRGAQPFFDTAFDMMSLLWSVDRYDIRGPSSSVGNHPGSRVKNAAVQLAGAYRNIVWNTGDLETAFADGLQYNYDDKSDDTGVLYTWLENLTGPGGGIYLNGDHVADMWRNRLTSASATVLRTKYMTFGFAARDHVPTLGINPLVVGDIANQTLFRDISGPDTMVVFGGCPLINGFDVLTAEGTANQEMSYRGMGNTGGAIVSDTTVNAVGNTVGFILSGFSYHYIRDTRAMGIPVRAEHLHRIHTWFADIADYPVPVVKPSVTRTQLNQNYPNPF